MGAHVSPTSGLTSQLFSEAACHRKGHANSLPNGVGARVLKHLYAEFPSPVQPKFISRATRQSHEAVKKWLSRNNGKYVVNVGNGWYRAKANWNLLSRIGIEPVSLHNLGVRIESLKGGPPPDLEGQGTRQPNGDVKGEFNGRNVIFQATADGGAWIQCRATKDPFSVPEFGEFASWVQGIAGKRPVRIEQWDLSVDPEDHRMRMDGVKAVTLRGFTDHLWKIYSKAETKATRIEACWHRLDMRPDEAAAMLHAVTSRPSAMEMPHWQPEVS